MVFWGERSAALSFLDRSQDTQQMLSCSADDSQPGSPHQVLIFFNPELTTENRLGPPSRRADIEQRCVDCGTVENNVLNASGGHEFGGMRISLPRTDAYS